jgi:phosphatidylserine/phosphatidylglycerophosphate/cardiolipin synthase-like enzyme
VKLVNLGLIFFIKTFSFCLPPEIILYHSPTHSLSQKLSFHLQEAKERVEGAFYKLSFSLIEVLLELKQRNVKVRLVVNSPEHTEKLEERGIEVVIKPEDGGVMHNKFCIIDQKFLWTGSYNPADTNSSNDNAVFLKIPLVAKNYQAEFEELFKGEFGGGAKTLSPKVLFDNLEIETYFAPEDGVKGKICHALRRAKEKIIFALYAFCDEDYLVPLLERASAGVKIKGIVSRRFLEQFPQYLSLIEKLQKGGIEVLISPSLRIMHHKFLVIDREQVITGSFNLTSRADNENDENILIIHSEEVAQVYEGVFQSLGFASSSRPVLRVTSIYSKPNPAVTTARVFYHLSFKPRKVLINLYTLSGELVKILSPPNSTLGYNEVTWGLTNQSGLPVADGFYFIQVKAFPNEGDPVSGFGKLVVER